MVAQATAQAATIPAVQADHNPHIPTTDSLGRPEPFSPMGFWWNRMSDNHRVSVLVIADVNPTNSLMGWAELGHDRRQKIIQAIGAGGSDLRNFLQLAIDANRTGECF